MPINCSSSVGTAQAAMDQLRDRELIDLIKACTQPVLGFAWYAAAQRQAQ